MGFFSETVANMRPGNVDTSRATLALRASSGDVSDEADLDELHRQRGSDNAEDEDYAERPSQPSASRSASSTTPAAAVPVHNCPPPLEAASMVGPSYSYTFTMG